MITAQEAQQRKQRILNTAYSLFTEKGIDKVGYGDVAEASGISESSIYRYFPKKSYLLLEMYKYLWKDMEVRLKEVTVETETYQIASGLQQIEYLIDAFNGVHTKDKGYLKFAMECKLHWSRQGFRISQSEYDGIIAPIIQLFAAALRKGTEDNSVNLPASFDESSFVMWGILRSYMEQRVILEGFYMGENRYRNNMKALKEVLLKSLR